MTVGAVVVALVGAGVGATVELPEAGGVGAVVGATLWVRGGREEAVVVSVSSDSSRLDPVVAWMEEGEVCGKEMVESEERWERHAWRGREGGNDPA